jgi:hypothetical protein
MTSRTPAGMTQFLGTLTGSVPVPAFFAPGNLFKLIGPLGMTKLAWNKARAPRNVAVVA